MKLYTDPVTMFFRAYEPLNSKNMAIVYLYEDDKKTIEKMSNSDPTKFKFTEIKS